MTTKVRNYKTCQVFLSQDFCTGFNCKTHSPSIKVQIIINFERQKCVKCVSNTPISGANRWHSQVFKTFLGVLPVKQTHLAESTQPVTLIHLHTALSEKINIDLGAFLILKLRGSRALME